MKCMQVQLFKGSQQILLCTWLLSILISNESFNRLLVCAFQMWRLAAVYMVVKLISLGFGHTTQEISPLILGNGDFFSQFSDMSKKIKRSIKKSSMERQVQPEEPGLLPASNDPLHRNPRDCLVCSSHTQRGLLQSLSPWRCRGSQAAQAVAVPDEWFSRFKGNSSGGEQQLAFMNIRFMFLNWWRWHNITSV